jgi:hypothetical protein
LLKKSAKVLLYFGLDCGLLVSFKYFTHKPKQETIVESPAFLEHGLAEKITICAHTTRDPNN